MKVREIMSRQVIGIGAEESAAVAARRFAQYNIGVLPVCGEDGRLCGMLTDRDLVLRCMAAGWPPEKTAVSRIMTRRLVCAGPEMDVGVAAHLMGRQQLRRLPVVENGALCGIVTLADLAAREDGILDAADALADITGNLSVR